MPEVQIRIGGRTFDIACQDGEQQNLAAAAERLDDQARALLGHVGRLPEAQMLLMAGLMLADKMSSYEDAIAGLEATLAHRQNEIAMLRNTPAPPPEKVEVAVIPDAVHDVMAELAARTEALAAAVEEQTKS